MAKDNAGFSLVELLICITLLVLLFGGAFALMLSGTRINNSVTTSLDMQLDARTALESVAERLIDCDGASIEVAPSPSLDRTLTVVDKAGGPAKLAFFFDYVKQELTLVSYNGLTDDMAESGLLMRDVSSFEVSFSPSGDTASSARVTLTIRREGRERTEERVIALRNSPLIFPNAAELTDAFE